MSLKRRLALFSCICGGCYVGFYNPKQLDADFKAFWHSTPKLTTGSIRVAFSMKPEMPPRTEPRRNPPRRELRAEEQRLISSGKLPGEGYKAAKRTAAKAKTPRG